MMEQEQPISSDDFAVCEQTWMKVGSFSREPGTFSLISLYIIIHVYIYIVTGIKVTFGPTRIFECGPETHKHVVFYLIYVDMWGCASPQYLARLQPAKDTTGCGSHHALLSKIVKCF